MYVFKFCLIKIKRLKIIGNAFYTKLIIEFHVLRENIFLESHLRRAKGGGVVGISVCYQIISI